MPKDDISIDLLRELIAYCPKTGELRWKVRDQIFFKTKGFAKAWNAQWAGELALSCQKGNGYLHGDIFNRHYMAHRVAYAIYHSKWPSGQIDHINGIRSDNRICNIRQATVHQNQRNKPNRVFGLFFCSRSNLWNSEFMVEKARIRTSGHKCFGKAVKAQAFLNNIYGCDFSTQPRNLNR